MKKLRMIVTVVVVLAIVGSAFAFKVKGGARFCILDISVSGDNCTTYTDCNLKTTVAISGVAWKYYPSFDGNLVACTTTNNHLCTGTTRITTD